MSKPQKQRGSVALISIMIISSILILIVLGMSEVNISNNYSCLNTNSDQLIYGLAESCFEDSIKRLEENTSFEGATTNFSDPESQCTTTINGSDPYTIDVEITYQNYTQIYEGQVSITAAGQANNADLLNWEKIE